MITVWFMAACGTRERFGKCLRGLVLGMLCGSVVQAAPYVPPASNRSDINLNSPWQFFRADVAGAQNPGFDDSAWTTVSVPHTWNNLDGQDGNNTYYQGIGWYRRHYTVPGADAGREFFLEFEGANLVADVYVNGTFIGEHQGGYSAFTYDVTSAINAGADNVIAVKVNNAYNADIPPLSADYTFFGGLYRTVHLLVLDKLHVTPLDYGSSGVYLQQSSVSATAATIQVTAKLRNDAAGSSNITVTAVIVDATNNVVATLTTNQLLAAGSTQAVVQTAILANPHLWNGRADPYLYQAYVTVSDGVSVNDLVQQPLGLRFMRFDPTNGFFLNGQYLDLHGVGMHQDRLNEGWAISDADQTQDISLVAELGATSLRLTHYPHSHLIYDLCDENGIIVWSEIPLINSITVDSNFFNNVQQQLQEAIHQNFNHPSIIVWSLFNELQTDDANTQSLVTQLNTLAHSLDPTRMTTAAAYAGVSINAGIHEITDLIAYNEYYGWYNGTYGQFGGWADSTHGTLGSRVMGLTEYGAGGSIYQHLQNPPTPSNVNSPGVPHYEEYEDLLHESTWQQAQARPYLWIKSVWTMFDFASDSRDEGDTPGRNDKGLMTYDRQTRKDAFYWYKANWTTNALVYITSRRFTPRTNTTVEVKVYANCASVQLNINGASLGSLTSTNHIFDWPGQTLTGGTNTVIAIGTQNSQTVTDTVVWLALPGVPAGLIVSPGNAQVALTWTASPGATSYNVKRSTVSGGPYTTIASPSGASYTDTGVVTDATYYYVVSAVSPLGESANTTEVIAQPGAFALAVDSGGGAAGQFTADAYVSGGSNSSTIAAIITNGLVDPAPQAVYQTERWGSFTYTFGGLDPGASCTVRLHFAEIYWSGPGERVFNVAINGAPVLTNFDIFAVTGAKFTATIQSFTATAASNGQITVQYTPVIDQPKSSGIEIIKNVATCPMITAGPAGQAVCNGSAATFTVTAGGAAPLHYVWRKLGSGWGNAWVFSNSGTATVCGEYLGTSTANGYTGDPGNDGDIDTAGKSWGLYASGGFVARADRALNPSLAVGQTFAIDMDVGDIPSPGKVGFELHNGPTARFAFQFIGGQSDFTIDDAASVQRDSGVPYTTQGVHLEFTLTDADHYFLTVSPVGDDTYGVGNVSPLPVTISGTLTGTPGTVINDVHLYNYQVPNDANNPRRDAFFNSLRYGCYDDNAANYTNWTGDLGNSPISGAADNASYTTPALSYPGGGVYDVCITNSCGIVSSLSATVTVNQNPAITTLSLPAGTNAVNYSQPISASGGAGPYTFNVTAGNLPPGLSLSPGGLVSGVPTVSSNWTFTVTTTDTNGCAGSQAYTLAITGLTPFQAWQVLYFGSTTNSAAAPGVDFDGDGFTNLQKFLAGINPTNSATSLRIISVTTTGINVQVGWTTVGGKSYVVQSAPSAGGSYTDDFTDASPVIAIPGTGYSITNYVDPGGATNNPPRFYRIRLGP